MLPLVVGLLLAAAAVGLGGLGCLQLAAGQAAGAVYLTAALVLLVLWWPPLPPAAIP